MQHISAKPPGFILNWALKNSFEIDISNFKKSALPAENKKYDLHIILGGALNVNDIDKHPWIKAELNYVKDRIFSGECILGICLGAQIIARALDFIVEKNVRPEIGWFEVRLNENYKKEAFFDGVPQKFTPLHWHSEKIILPENIKSIAESDATKVQAFRFLNALALQFHLEQTVETIDEMLKRSDEIIKPDIFVLSKQTIRDNFDRVPEANTILEIILNNMLKQNGKI